MRNTFLLSIASALLLFTSSCAKKTSGATAVGDDGVDWVARAKQYRQDPAALRAFTEKCEESAARLEATERQLGEYRTQSATTTQELSTARANTAQLNDRAQALMRENEALRGQLTALAAAKNDRVDTDIQVVQGVIFQVQLGAYAKNRVDPSLATEDALELQDQNGMQKVVVSQFRTYANAERLRDRLKIMGVKDAFVVAKHNGQRVTVPEALRIAGQ